ncbi:MAG: hypothetical protein Q9201_007047 [Fulgogasparrea decipioides]
MLASPTVGQGNVSSSNSTPLTGSGPTVRQPSDPSPVKKTKAYKHLHTMLRIYGPNATSREFFLVKLRSCNTMELFFGKIAEVCRLPMEDIAAVRLHSDAIATAKEGSV